MGNIHIGFCSCMSDYIMGTCLEKPDERKKCTERTVGTVINYSFVQRYVGFPMIFAFWIPLIAGIILLISGLFIIFGLEINL